MSGKTSIRVFMILVLCSAVLMLGSCDEDHEHPAEHPEEHPSEHPEGGGKTATLTKDQLADAVEDHVEAESAKTGGFFVVTDDQTGEQLKLKLDKVHRKRLSKVGADKYFACADFESDTGRMYDLDVFMTGTSKDNLVFSEFTVHKVNGKERYTWHEKDGMWFKKPAGEGEEHPKEHPKEHPAEHPK